MKLSVFLPLAATATAIVLPEDEVMRQIAIEDHSKHSFFDQVEANLPTKDHVKHTLEDALSSLVQSSKNVLDDAFDWASSEFKATEDYLTEGYFDTKNWLACSMEEHDDPNHGKHPHHGPPGDHSPHDKPDHDRPRRPPHRKPRKSNYTVYELINSSKYTTKLAELINGDEDLIKLLNGTEANFTVFAPTDKAFEKIPDHGKEPSKELIQKVLSYHISSEFYPAGRILVTRTVPTLLEGKHLSSHPEDTPQRISTNIGFRGLTLNYYSRVVAVDILGSNGVIHGIDSLLIPPPSAARIISLLPSEFSTLELALRKTELWDALDPSTHVGGTLFAPTNWAFTKLGPKINAFLFSEYGRKYLAALLKYHVSANQTLYSDAFYAGGSPDVKNLDRHRIPKGKYHVDLPTLLEDRYLSIDIGRYGRLIDIRINGFASVYASDGVAKDGVVHVLTNVLIPPKKIGGAFEEYQGGELTVEDLKERLDEFVDNADEPMQEADRSVSEGTFPCRQIALPQIE